MLGASVAAQAGASVAINGPAFLIPSLQDDRGLSLAQAGTVAAMPIAGVMVTLFLWGLLVDRIGERTVLLAGLGATALLGVLATLVEGTVELCAVLFVLGTAAACTGSASGRIVVGWFPPRRRGLAMGIRQMAQPLGVAVAAATIAVTAEQVSLRAALWIPVVAVALAFVAVLVLVLDPPRPIATAALTANPYRADGFLARLHAVSVMLVIPQFLVWAYSLTWLVQERQWSAAAAGAPVAGTHVLGALGRIAVGQLSDVVVSRVRPLRWVAIAAWCGTAGHVPDAADLRTNGPDDLDDRDHRDQGPRGLARPGRVDELRRRTVQPLLVNPRRLLPHLRGQGLHHAVRR